MLIRSRFPRLFAHLKSRGIHTSVLTSRWICNLFRVCLVIVSGVDKSLDCPIVCIFFFCHFPYLFFFHLFSLPLQNRLVPLVRTRVIDIFVMEGRVALYAASLAIFHIFEEDILQYDLESDIIQVYLFFVFFLGEN